jgi:glycerol-3-phosphate dehydrogenase
MKLVGADGYKDPPPGSTDDHLARRYGSEVVEVKALIAFDRSLAEPLVPGLPYIRAEAVHAVRHEMATTLDDVLARRTRAHLFNRTASLAAAPAVAALIGGELGWEADEIARQVANYRTICESEQRAAAVTEPDVLAR